MIRRKNKLPRRWKTADDWKRKVVCAELVDLVSIWKQEQRCFQTEKRVAMQMIILHAIINIVALIDL